MLTKRKSNFHNESDWMPASSVRPDPSNANEHSQRSIEAIARSLLRFGFRKPIVADKHKVVRAGNGTLEAVRWIAENLNSEYTTTQTVSERAQQVGILRAASKAKTAPLVPYVRCEITHLEGDEAVAYALADNQTGRLSKFNFEAVARQLGDLKTRTTIDDLGWSDFELEPMLAAESNLAAEPSSEAKSVYTKSIKAPIYEPKGECPPIADLFDNAKTLQLIAEIKSSNLPEDVASFLMLAATRHTAFHFRNIAEYYCHANAVVQDLMERSGLIIIDFKKAIEYGFVHMTERLGQIADIKLEEGEE